MSEVTIDTSELRAFRDEILHHASYVAVRHARPVVQRGAQNIKEQLQAEARGSRHFRLERAISYDIEDDGFAAEIGPEKGGAGSLANIAYFGGANGGGGTVPDPRAALDAEIPRFIDQLAQIADQL